MTLKDTYKTLTTLLADIQADLEKAEEGNKAAAQRVRTQTIQLEKIAKIYRRESIKSEKTGGLKSSKGNAARKAPVAKAKAGKPVAKQPMKPSIKQPSRPAVKKPAAKSPAKSMGRQGAAMGRIATARKKPTTPKASRKKS